MDKASYRKLRHYKYQLTADYTYTVDIKDHQVQHPMIELGPEGQLTVKKGYAWDGPSGPTIDTSTFMRGALIHDVLYQLIRLEYLAPSLRQYADDVLKQICLQDGMSRFRAWYVHLALKLFGSKHAQPGTDEPDTIYQIPTS